AIAHQQHGGDQGGTEKVARHGPFLLSAPPAPEGLAEVRAVRPAAVPRPILSQELLDVGALLARGGVLERLHELRSSLLDDAEPEVELTEGAPGREGLRIEGDRTLELGERGIDLAVPCVGDPQERPNRCALTMGLE